MTVHQFGYGQYVGGKNKFHTVCKKDKTSFIEEWLLPPFARRRHRGGSRAGHWVGRRGEPGVPRKSLFRLPDQGAGGERVGEGAPESGAQREGEVKGKHPTNVS